MTDWTAEYDNRAAVPESEEIISDWKTRASSFRSSSVKFATGSHDIPYSDGERNTLDLFSPKGASAGTVIFIHGGYWRMLDKSYFSHFAAGPIGRNWACAIPSYPLAPQARIGKISRAVAAAIERVANTIDGPLRLIGHSAGGHLVSRMMCADNLLSDGTFKRIENTVAVSGLYELENLQYAAMNADLKLDPEQVRHESPTRIGPRENARITCLVGAIEKPEFLRQNELLVGWRDKGAEVKTLMDKEKNHFTVIESLAEPHSLLTNTLLA